MQKVCIEALAKQQVKLATCQEGHQVASETVVGGHERHLRQTVVGVVKGYELAQRYSTGEATAYVLSGRFTLTHHDNSWTVRSGDLLKIPQDGPWQLRAVEDGALLLTTSTPRTAPLLEDLVPAAAATG